MLNSRRPRLALTIGDPAGIGPELVAAWLAGPPDALHREVDWRIIGPEAVLASLPPAPDVEMVPLADSGGFLPVPGQPTVEGARWALAALERAARFCREGLCAGVVTLPVSKIWMQRTGAAFPGQTEFFEQAWGGRATMAFTSPQLRVALATRHIPLRAVPDALEPEILSLTLKHVHAWLLAEGVARPRLAVCGLNPHAGEEGMLGPEEIDWIDPCLETLVSRFPGLLPRAQPADTVFHRALLGQLDAVIALYHDQGLGPLKTVAFEDAAQVSLGLPFVRTSPDHGTAFDIAGKGLASGKSLAVAMATAVRLARTGTGPDKAGP